MHQEEFIVSEEQCSKRLDSILKSRYSDHSRTYLANIVSSGGVKVSGKITTKASQKLKYGATVELTFPEPEPMELKPTPVDFEIIDTQEHFLIINKPAGLMVHPAATAPKEITLVHGLLHKFGRLPEVFGNQRPGIVHRLDKDTSGLLIVARTPKGFNAFSELFKNRSIKKTYLAKVQGKVEKCQGKILTAIGRHPVLGNKMCINGINAKSAETHYKVLTTENEQSILEVDILTGRTHQIRVHLASIGYPVSGDQLYSKKSKKEESMGLHAWKLEFSVFGKKFQYQTETPNKFKITLP